MIKNYPYKYRDHSHIAAAASLAAREQNRYWEMHDMMLERSPALDRDSLVGYAAKLGLDVEKFKADLDSAKHRDQIERDKKLAVELDLYNTPSFFINGRMVLGARSFEYMKKIIDEELSAQPESEKARNRES